MGVFTNVITEIKEGKGEKGPFKLLTVQGRPAPSKVWGPIASQYTVPGTYKVTSTKNEEGRWVTSSVELVSGSGGQNSSKSSNSGLGQAFDQSTNDAITKQVIFKCAAQVVAASTCTNQEGLAYLNALIEAMLGHLDKKEVKEDGPDVPF